MVESNVPTKRLSDNRLYRLTLGNDFIGFITDEYDIVITDESHIVITDEYDIVITDEFDIVITDEPDYCATLWESNQATG
ncbi:hypothetical protein RJ55_03528 [Drechmeria coniospora]|nr:hypothetical protein RJ55_03528 [Drechmeria coniospora]